MPEVFREIEKFGTGFKDIAFLTLDNVTVKDFVVVLSKLLNAMSKLGGIIVQLLLPVTEHKEFDISMTDGTVIDTVPVGDWAGRI